ncbi:hypothetical protein [Pedobacter nyackensis]|uniref:hypothetical protein n=1 Tax=Pedobacter nyackensis TaxID=475255 RepID=UPI00292E0A3E|nr:hypothetical protein [Pedobacter nyackensis]
MYVISLVNDLEQSEMAIREHSFIEGDQICVYAIAVDESEALKMARKVKEKFIGSH